jgi:hypothetical protein
MKAQLTQKNVVAFAAVAIAVALLGGAVLAAIPGAGGEISACYNRSGKVRVIDAEAGETCKSRETPLAWNQIGPRGPSDAYVATMSPLSPLPGGETLTMVSMDVPAGSYVIDAQVRVRSQVIYDGGQISCDLYGAEQLDIFNVNFAGGIEAESFKEKVMPLAGWTTLTTPGTIRIECRADYQDVDLSTIGVFESPLIATRVESITEAP